MKERFPATTILVVSSWTGNLILTTLAIILAWNSPYPLTPLTFATLAACILLGNALPISVHLINLWWAQARLRAEEKEASLSLRHALARVEAVEQRLQDAHDASAKAILIARQIPERLHERTDKLLEAMARLDPDALQRTADMLGEHGEVLRENLEFARAYENRLIEQQGANEAETIRTLQQQLAERQATGDAIDRILATCTKLRDSVRALATARAVVPIADLPAAPPPVKARTPEPVVEPPPAAVETQSPEPVAEPPPAAVETQTSEPVAEPPPEPADLSATPPPPDPAADPAPAAESGAVHEPAATAADRPDAPPPPRVRKAGRPAKRRDNQSELDGLDSTAPVPDLPSDQAVLVVQAMVGILNRIYVRGEGGGLRPDKGLPLELTGIGEYRHAFSGLAGPIRCRLLLNDNQPATGDEIIVAPGAVTRVKPVFAG
jgi:hypothetical protein